MSRRLQSYAAEGELVAANVLVEVRGIDEVRCSAEVALKVLEIRSQKQSGDFEPVYEHAQSLGSNQSFSSKS